MSSFVLPLSPLLRAYLASEPPPPTARSLAIEGARRDWLNADFLAATDESPLRKRLVSFYETVVDPPLHGAALARRARLVRHGLNHLLHGSDPVSVKFDRCVAGDGAYAVSGMGVRF